MKIAIFVSLLTASVVTVQAQEWYSREPILNKKFGTEAIGAVRAETSGGNLTVEGTDGEPHVEVYVWPSNRRDRNLSREEIQRKLDEEYDLTVSVSDRVLTAIAKPKEKFLNWNRSLSISFRIYTPHSVSTDLRTSGGNISLSGLTGAKQEFRTSGGNLNVARISGNIVGRTSGGNISISDANPNSKEEIDLSTSGGNISADHCKGAAIRLSTSGGNLSMRYLEGTVTAGTSGGTVDGETINGDLSAHTSGGNVHMSDLSGSLQASTSGGNIDVTMTGVGKFVKIHNSGGNIALQMPGGQGMDLSIHGDRISTTTLTNFKGDIGKKHIEGTLNGGGIPVDIDGSSGGIQLTLK
ncbi:MAG: DUF4097 family beta strand repeat-containing protein [Puia sp.]|nr:DUF4097 family beta strand repeat-containing protein [Puia sp.]